jgi:aspartate-semialdehyde dehydrogenase
VTTHSKTATAHTDTARAGNLYRLAIVGAANLKGKEVAEVISDRNFPSIDTKLLDDDESLGKLESIGDEVSFIQSVRSQQFDKVDFTFFACDQDCTRRNWKNVRDAGSAIVDLSYALEDEPGAVVRSPWVERQLGHALTLDLQPGPSVTAHPAAVVLALLLLRGQKVAAIKNAVATVFEPASEHGQKGMDELHEQTVNLLSFQQLPKNIFDTQVAFNMISRYGEHANPPLASVEQRILKHYQRISGSSAPLPSLLVLQAPIFHGYAFAIHMQMDQVVDVEQFSQALSGEHVNIAQPVEDAPSNVSVAGQGNILLSVKPDPNDPNGVWLWAAADNLRVAATTAVECAETMAATRPRGKIQ